MDRKDEVVFERWYGKAIMQSARLLREALQDDDMYQKLYTAFEAGLERGKRYDGRGQCCGSGE